MQELPADFHEQLTSRDWSARWIGPEELGPHGTRVLFRRTFEVAEPVGAQLFISAERDYQLFINGRFIHRGPPPSPYYYKFYDQWELSRHLTTGTNTIAVYVSQIGAPIIGLLAELVDAHGRVLLTTDEHWRVTSRTGWSVPDTPAGGENDAMQEYFDMRLHPCGWEQPGFDDSAWASPQLYAPIGARRCPWKRVVPRHIPPLAEWDVRPQAVAYTEEGLDVMSRRRAESLSVTLSAAGRPVQQSTIEAPESLCTDHGVATLQCSTAHLHDRAFDGIYAPAIVLDFGKIVTGYFTLEVETEDGGQLDVGYVERLLNGHFNNAIEVPYADRYDLAAGAQTLTSTIWKGFRYVKLRMSKTEKPVVLNHVRTRVCTYDYTARGAFESDDAILNRTFEISRYTLRLCSRDYLMDTPWRERNQWLGDNSAVTLPGIYACFGDTAIPEQFLRQAAATPLPDGRLINNSQGFDPMSSAARARLGNSIPDYSLYWVHAIWRHYLFTADAALLREVYRHVLGILHFHWRHLDDRGLVCDLPGRPFIDHIFQPRTGTVAPYNAIWYGTLEDAIALAQLMGDDHTVDQAKTCRAALAANFGDVFFDPALGCFRDDHEDGAPAGRVSEHSNLAALRWGLASESQTAQVIDALYDTGNVPFLEAEPFFCHVVLPALRGVGRTDLALQLVRDRWGRRMVDQGMSSVTEEWNATASRRGPNNSYVGIYRSLSHAWSACPAEFLLHQLTGFQIIEPGCGVVRFAPVATEFDYRVTIPTPRGDLHVAYQQGDAQITAPDAITVQRDGDH